MVTDALSRHTEWHLYPHMFHHLCLIWDWPHADLFATFQNCQLGREIRLAQHLGVSIPFVSSAVASIAHLLRVSLICREYRSFSLHQRFVVMVSKLIRLSWCHPFRRDLFLSFGER